MTVDLRSERPGGTWTRHFGDHEQNGFEVSIADKSAHVTMTSLGILFAVDRRDVPAAWAAKINVAQLRVELIAAIVHRMSAEVLEELFREVSSQRSRAFCNGEETKAAIREALGL